MNKINYITTSILGSYSQVFFSQSRWMGLLILLVTMLDPWAGFSGVLSVVISNLAAYIFSLNKQTIQKGLYGFNSLLVGLGIGLYYQPSLGLYVVVLFIALLTLMVTIVVKGILAKYSLPFLSIPFLIGIWVITLAGSDLYNLGLSERGIYTANELYTFGGSFMIAVYEWFNALGIPDFLRSYFLSLGAIFFQYTVFSGIVIAIGLLACSRISFTLSLLGYFTAMLFYQIIGADFTVLSYNYIGFNYILTAIAIGGFFFVPSLSGYLIVVILLPLVVLLTISTHAFFSMFGLPVYSLPFNIVVISFLYTSRFREKIRFKFREVVAQHYNPEKNVYYSVNKAERFRNNAFLPVSLPFFGEWNVMQGQNGEYTHKGDWRHAWDFVIKDELGEQFRGKGNVAKNYYCYEKNVIAPAGGYVVEVVDEVGDNNIGETNLKQNWGNSIVIKHGEYLFSQLSHLKKGSISVAIGDYVRKGAVVALVGNSGRSSFPHLHFQLQATPYVGSKTIDYPICNYLKVNTEAYEVKSFSKPSVDEVLSNPPIDGLMEKAFGFVPGKTLTFKVMEQGRATQELEWEVKTDQLNNVYLHCGDSDSFAYLYNNGTVHYAMDFVGDKKSFLFLFHAVLYNVQLAFNKNMTLSDSMPSNYFFGKRYLFFQDFVAPFYYFLKSRYNLKYTDIDDDFSPERIDLNVGITNTIFNRKHSELKADVVIENKRINQFKIEIGKREIVAVWKE